MTTKKNGNSKEISAAKRRDVIKKELEGASGPVTANYFANRLSVSRQSFRPGYPGNSEGIYNEYPRK